MISNTTIASPRAFKKPVGVRRTISTLPINDETAADTSSPRNGAESRTRSDHTGETDAELIERFKAGDESVFVEIMNRHHAKICTVAHNLLHNHADAEEIAQDTFVRAYRNLRGFRGDSSLATWLHRIAFNLARNRYWYFFRRRRHATLSLDCPIREESEMTLTDLISASTPDPAHETEREEFLKLVAAAMEKLDAGHRKMLALRNVKNLSYAEIAQLLGIKIGTVKSGIARAREHLLARLAEACPEFEPDARPSEWFAPSRETGSLVPEWA